MRLGWFGATSVQRLLSSSILACSAVLALGADSALAYPSEASPTPLQCLDQWETNDNYVGDGWVAVPVRRTSGTVLGCGDERSGVIHIGHPDTTGNLHPITAETEEAFLSRQDRRQRRGGA